MSKKRKAGANIKSIEEMINEQESVAEPYLEALDKSKESMAEKFIEAIDKKNNENMGDKEMEEMVKQDVKEVEGVEIAKEELNVKGAVEKMDKVTILNANIRGVIIATKDMGKRGLLNGQLKAIINDYKSVTGVELDEERINYIKTLKDEQAKHVIKVIEAYKRYLRLQQNTQLATNQ